MTGSGDADEHPDDALLRLAVGDHVGVEAQRVQVGRRCPRCDRTDHGRPRAGVPGRPDVWVSLARSERLVVAAACASAPVGVDLEAWSRFPLAGFAEVALHAREHATDPRDQALVWVRKEALLKSLGTGLTTDPRGVRLSPPGEPPALVAWHGPDEAPRVDLRDLDVEDHAACLAVLGAGGRTARVTLRWAAREALPGRARRRPAR